MPCSDCGYELCVGRAECPRCLYRSHVRQSQDTTATPPIVGEPPAPDAPSAPPPSRRRWIVAAAIVLAGGLLLARPLLNAHRMAQEAETQEQRAGAAFASADGPCRRGADARCREGITALLALRDHSDASLLLGDYRVARYLQTRPGASALGERWRQDQFSGAELMTLGEQARRQHLAVFRSFWMYANIKQNRITVPTLTINNDLNPNPFGSR